MLMTNKFSRVTLLLMAHDVHNRWREIDFILKTISRRPENLSLDLVLYARDPGYERDDWIPRTSRGTSRPNKDQFRASDYIVLTRYSYE